MIIRKPPFQAVTDSYRYGFQGQEKDDEVKGEGNSLNYTFRMHDPRVGRFFAIDPLASQYPSNSPYAFSENRVMDAVELEGLEQRHYILDLNESDPKVRLVSGEDCWAIFDKVVVRVMGLPEGKQETYTFTPWGNSRLAPMSTRTTNNNIQDFDEFFKDNPVEELASGRYSSNSEVNRHTVIEVAEYLILRRLLKSKMHGTKTATQAKERLPRDVALGDMKPAPRALPTKGRTIGKSKSQNTAVQDMVEDVKAKGATDIRINQQQVNAEGNHVGVNRPDLQYTLDGKRHYVEWDTKSSKRGAAHEYRALANDPKGEVNLIIMD